MIVHYCIRRNFRQAEENFHFHQFHHIPALIGENNIIMLIFLSYVKDCTDDNIAAISALVKIFVTNFFCSIKVYLSLAKFYTVPWQYVSCKLVHDFKLGLPLHLMIKWPMVLRYAQSDGPLIVTIWH